MKGDLLIGLETPEIGEDADRPPKRYVDDREVRRHTVVFFVASLVAFLALGLLFATTPCGGAASTVACGKEVPTWWRETSLLLTALVAGAVGGFVHALTSFADFAGNRQLLQSWVPWLYLRPGIGSLLGVIVYFALRAKGLSGFANDGGCTDVYVVALATSLTGLFSKQAADKLSDLVENIFASSQRPVRHDELHSAGAGPGSSSEAPASSSTGEMFDATVKRIQHLLIERGYLPATDASGRARDDGILDDGTRTAIQRFLLEHGVSGSDRAQIFGDEQTPDFWPKVLDFIEHTPLVK